MSNGISPSSIMRLRRKNTMRKRCIAVFSLAYSFNAAGQGNQWSFKATDSDEAYYSRRVRSYTHLFCAI